MKGEYNDANAEQAHYVANGIGDAKDIHLEASDKTKHISQHQDEHRSNSSA
ncbi:MAG: hypothetical protein Q4D23_04195 [Bacteroidales bacterium]|nr:hypothetical protein [Bacteroidales bacterium]